MINKQQLLKYATEELIANGNVRIIDEMFSTNYTAHAEEKEYKGHSFIQNFIDQLRTAIKDIKILKTDFFIE